MGALEVVLLIVGGLVFTISFLIPAGKADSGIREIVQEEVKTAVAREIDGMKSKIEDMTEETVGHAMEKTERSLERVSNEKIMAVNEYSDTVLAEINRNHKEVMFLYDMLNDKHQNIKNTVSKVEMTVKEAEQKAKEVESTVQEVESAVQSAKGKRKKTVAEEPKKQEKPAVAEAAKEDLDILVPVKKTTRKAAKAATKENPGLDISFMQGSNKNGNNNEKILQLHKAGKSNVAIAKELGLGVGEVKLVIDLFEGV